MVTTGIICEYNPFHLGHQKQLRYAKAQNPEGALVCLMSGSFVQRGHPAIFSPGARAKAAVLCGADLVLELPVNVSLSSAEGFAAGGVEILTRLGTDRLCFGTETREPEKLTQAAQALLHPDFSPFLKKELETGCSFPAARSRAAARLGADPEVLCRPNDILAVEYTKAILSQGSAMACLPMRRPGDYHDRVPRGENPSATALRPMLLEGSGWEAFIPPAAGEVFGTAVPHSLAWGEKAILSRLYAMDEEAFSRVPYGSEGLWRKLMKASRESSCLEELADRVKSKRYTRTRIDRMILCAFLGLTGEDMAQAAPYVRILACNATGRRALRELHTEDFLVNLGKRMQGDWAETEGRCRRLYSLFAKVPETVTREERVFILEE